VGSKQDSLLGGLGPIEPIAPTTGKTAYGRDEVIRRILKTPAGRRYARFALLTNIADARKVDAVGLLIAAIGLGIPSNRKAFLSVANRLREGINKPEIQGDIYQWIARQPGGDSGLANRVSVNAKVSGYAFKFPQTVPQKVQTAAELAAGKEAKGNPWVVIQDGKVSYVQSVSPPKNVLVGSTSNGIIPIRRSDYLQKKSLINEYYQKYIGSNVDDAHLATILKTGMSEGAIINMLSKSPKFFRGQIWQAQAPSIKGYAKALMGENYKVPAEFIRKAIINNWSEGTLRRKLIEKPEYLQGPEFRQNVSQLQNVYSSIQGRPDEAAMQGIKEAALGGWSSDQYAAYLRNRPEYTGSQEYKSKALSFLDALGLVTGEQATTQGIGTLGSPLPVPGIETQTPNSPRLPEPGGIGGAAVSGKVGAAIGAASKPVMKAGK
jgi:hypothetical protein